VSLLSLTPIDWTTPLSARRDHQDCAEMDSKPLPTASLFHVTEPRKVSVDKLARKRERKQLRCHMRSGEQVWRVMMVGIKSPSEVIGGRMLRAAGHMQRGTGPGKESTRTIEPRIKFESWDEEWRYQQGAVRLRPRPIGLKS